MELFDDGKIYICADPVDWRLRTISLIALAEIGYGVKLREERAYMIFYNRRKTSLRTVYHRDGTAYMFEARLDAGEGKYPLFFCDNDKHKISALTKEDLKVIFNRGVGEVKFSQAA